MSQKQKQQYDLRCVVRIVIDGLTESESKSIRDALEPDNTNMPNGLAVVIKCSDNSQNDGGKKTRIKSAGAESTHHNTLTLEFEGIERKEERKGGSTHTPKKESPHAMGHLVGTVDEVLEHVQVARGVLNGA